jgi:hypothetical protein
MVDPEKLGEPAISFQIKLFAGAEQVIYLPYYQDPVLPDKGSRLNFLPDLPTNSFAYVFTDHDGLVSDDKFGHQAAIRVVQTLGDFDISFESVYHSERIPVLFLFDPEEEKYSILSQRIFQFGGTTRYIMDPFVIKCETVWKHYFELDESIKNKYENALTAEVPEKTPDHGIFVFGLDYGFNVEKIREVVLFIEGQKVFGIPNDESRRIYMFQSDLLIGGQLALNDVMNKTLKLTGIVDTENRNEWRFDVNYSQRITDTWSMEIGARRIIADNHDGEVVGLEKLNNANRYYLKLKRSF